MRHIRVLMLALVMAVIWLSGAAGQNKEFTKLNNEELIKGLVETNFLTIECELPYIRPYLCELSSSVSTSESTLIETFFGKEDVVTEKEHIKNALWGEGTRFKSGQKIVVGPKNMPVQQAILMYGEEVDLVPVYLDVFTHGFAYRNNVPHKPVYASTHLPKTLYNDPTVKFDYVYPPSEGLTAAESVIAQMFGEISIPEGFQTSVNSYVMQTGERLYYYKLNPQFKTKYTVYGEPDIDAEGKIVPVPAGEAKVAVPIYDRFVTVILDGDKTLAGMDYFWDNSIKPIGEPAECIAASQAYMTAADSIFEYYNEQPPLITVREVKLAYIQNRRQPNLLIPVWMFDAAYARAATPQEMVSNEVIKYAENRILVPIPFAVNALTGDPFLL